MKRFVAALTSVIALLLSGSAAAALGPVDPTGTDPLIGIPDLDDSMFDGMLAPLGLTPPPGSSPASPPPTIPEGGLAKGNSTVAPPGPVAAAAATGRPFAGLAPGAFAGYATGTAYHSDTDGAEEIEVAFSGATYGSAPLAARADERGRSVAPGLGAAQGFGRGSAVEIGLELVAEEDLADLDDNADAKAPPNRDVVTKEVGGVDLAPLVDADLLRSQASARAATSGCVVGPDLAYGLGVANRTRLVEDEAEQPVLSLSADEPPQAVTQSVSRTRLVPPAAGARTPSFGLLSETRQTIAPITLFEGKPQELVVEVGGEWVLRAMADGTKGSLTYGPSMESSDLPMLRIFRPHGEGEKDDEVLTEVDLQTAFGGTGENLGVPGVFEVYIGEDPRAIGGDADSRPTVTGTLVAGAVDVVRARIPDPEGGTLDLRVGHMEVAVALPAAGITCPGVGMAKRSDPPTVAPGQRFAWTITVSNPNDCLLDKVKVVDTVTTTPGLRYDMVSTSPKARATGNTLTFDGIGPLRLGESTTVRVEVEVDEDSPPGRFTDEAVASGMCGPVRLAGEAETVTGVGVAAPQPVPMDGRVALAAPEVVPAAMPAPAVPPVPTPVVAGAAEVLPVVQPASEEPQLPRTGGLDGFLPAASLLVTASLLRRLTRLR